MNPPTTACLTRLSRHRDRARTPDPSAIMAAALLSQDQHIFLNLIRPRPHKAIPPLIQALIQASLLPGEARHRRCQSPVPLPCTRSNCRRFLRLTTCALPENALTGNYRLVLSDLSLPWALPGHPSNTTTTISPPRGQSLDELQSRGKQVRTLMTENGCRLLHGHHLRSRVTVKSCGPHHQQENLLVSRMTTS